MPGRILIVDDVATNRIVMKVKLTEACYEVTLAESGPAALRSTKDIKPDLVLLDYMLPGMDGIAVCKALKEDPETADIPVIIVTAGINSMQKLQALRAGAEDFLVKPLDETLLLARVRSLLRAKETEQELLLREGTKQALGFEEPASPYQKRGTIALIEGAELNAERLCTAMRPFLSADIVTLTRQQALAVPDSTIAPDVFLIPSTVKFPGDGLQLLTDLRSRAATRHAAALVVVPDTACEHAPIALDLGANDLLVGAFETHEATLRLDTLMIRKLQADRLRASVKDGLRLAVKDSLTGLFNRRYAIPHLKKLTEKSRLTNKPISVLLVDLDRFKSVNDRFGHAGGDAVLTEIAQRLSESLRPVDLIARIGGEEFLIVLPDTPLDAARMTAERLRKNIQRLPILLPDQQGSLHVSASFGVATGTGQDAADVLLHQADKALYAAKAKGRNTVTVCQSAA